MEVKSSVPFGFQAHGPLGGTPYSETQAGGVVEAAAMHALDNSSAESIILAQRLVTVLRPRLSDHNLRREERDRIRGIIELLTQNVIRDPNMLAVREVIGPSKEAPAPAGQSANVLLAASHGRRILVQEASGDLGPNGLLPKGTAFFALVTAMLIAFVFLRLSSGSGATRAVR